MPRTDDLECLHEWNAGREHGGELATEDCDVAGIDLPALATLTLLADFRGRDALTAQLGAQRLLVGGETPALDARAALIAALPREWNLALDCLECCDCCRSHNNFRPASLNRDAVDFLETGQAGFHFLEPGAPQIPHPFLGGLLSDLHCTAAGENDVRDRIGHR